MNRHERPLPTEDTLVAELLPNTEVVRGALMDLPILRPLRPEYYWSGDISVESVAPGKFNSCPVESDSQSNKSGIKVLVDPESYDSYLDAFTEDNKVSHNDLALLFSGYALVHDLAIRALRPGQINDLISHISIPNGLYSDLLESGLIDDPENDAIMREYFVGDEDRVAKTNVARFATGAVYTALHALDKGYKSRVTDVFRTELISVLGMGGPYVTIAQEKFNKTAEQGRIMFVEHLKIFNVAAGFPKHKHEIEDFVQVYQ